jgi:hypothetical protein
MQLLTDFVLISVNICLSLLRDQRHKGYFCILLPFLEIGIFVHIKSLLQSVTYFLCFLDNIFFFKNFMNVRMNLEVCCFKRLTKRVKRMYYLIHLVPFLLFNWKIVPLYLCKFKTSKIPLLY